MTASDEMYGTPGISDEDVLSTEHSRRVEAAANGEVLGVLTGQVPVKSMVIATGRRNGKTKAGEDWLAEQKAEDETRKQCCPGAGTLAHVRGCVNHPEHGRE